jgi:hypothetical protein
MSEVSIIVPVRSLDSSNEVVSHFPGGALEVLLQAGVGIGRARNNGARQAKGSIFLHTDDDVLLRGDLSWFDTRPASEMWWIASDWSTTTDDPYTKGICTFLAVQTALRLQGASVGSFQAMRRSAFEAVVGYAEEDVHDDMGMGRRLYQAFGPPHVAPFSVVILRRTVKATEHWQRHAALGPPTDGPALRLRPLPVA